MTAHRTVTATITPTGVLTVWGLAPDPHVVDEGAPPAARNALINLLHQHATAGGHPIRAAVRTPAGAWYMAVDPAGRCIPREPAEFAAPPPGLDPAATLAGVETVIAAAQAPQATLALASDPDPAIRSRAMAELATWPDDQALVAEAELPAPRLDELARCDRPWVRAGVAANPLTAPDTLAGLVDDPDPTVRMALAARYDLDPSAMAVLAADPDSRVGSALSRNPAAAFLAGSAPPPPRTSEHADPAPPAGDTAPTGGLDQEDLPGGVFDQEDDPADVDVYVYAPLGAAGEPDAGRGWSTRRRALAAGVAVIALVGAGGLAASAASAPAETDRPTEASTAPWNGMRLPVGPDGPADPTAAVATGFAHTEAGAALAAAHLSVRIDAYAGPGSFAPTITRQTAGGDPAALLAATRARYNAAAAAAEIADGQPIPTAPAQIVGWRIDGPWDPAAAATVHLRVEAGGPAVDYAIQVVWLDGDYVLIDPTATGNFTTSTAADPDRYRSF